MTKLPIRGLASSVWASGASSARARSQPPPSLGPPRPASPGPRAAPRDGNGDGSDARVRARAQALHRFEQACARLRWKSIDLENAYGRATTPTPWGFADHDAERNFKVDFYEYYTWIEQAIVLLLRVFGTPVDRQPAAGDGRANANAHAYHHNVLRALDDEAHPLHRPLGTGTVNQALWKAKELRNRWKSAAEGHDSPPLHMYDLHWIVGRAVQGLEAAYAVASARVREDLEAMDGLEGPPADGRAAHEHDGGGDGEGWAWMVEPMDWEA